MLLWILVVGIPVAAVGYIYFSNLKNKQNPRNQAYDPKTGLGRGAPGFQTNIQRIAIPADIAARIRAGEEVSAEEITRAREKMQKEEEAKARAAELGSDGNSTPTKRKKKSGKK